MMDGKPLIHSFEDEVNAVIDKYRDQGITFGEAIGVLETVKLNLWHEGQHREEENGNP
jgi:hypothetical protein